MKSFCSPQNKDTNNETIQMVTARTLTLQLYK